MTSLPGSRRALAYAVALAAAAAFASVTTAPVAQADVPPPPATDVTLAPGGIPASAQESGGYDLTAGGEALATAATQAVAPGLSLTNFQRLETGGWNAGNILTADLTEPTLSLDVRNTGAVAGAGTLTSQMAGTSAVAGINGDFFDMNYSNAPIGIAKSRSGLVNAPAATRPAFSLAGGRAMVGALRAGGTLTADGATHPLSGFNTPAIAKNGIGVYTPQWGTHTLDRPMGGPDALAPKVARATVVGGVVTDVRAGAGEPAIPAGGQVLLGREAGADVVGALEVGERVDVAVGLPDEVEVALSGSDQLVIDGEVNPALPDDGVHSRTAIGVTRDGSRVIALALDGQTAASHGLRRTELAAFMKSLGAYQALNLDGGGSTTMAARVAGSVEPRVVDTPSDGHEREVSNALLFFSSAAPQGVATAAQVRPVTNRSGAYTVLEGQTRTLFGSGLDATYAAVEQPGRFSAPGPVVRLGEKRGDRVPVTGLRAGDAQVGFHLSSGRRAAMPLTVLGPLAHLEADRAVLPFPDPSTSATVMLTGYDPDGRPSPIEPSEAVVTADPGIDVAPDGANGFVVRPTMAKGSGVVHFAVGDHHYETTVLVGLDQRVVADFADGSAWKAETARATGTLTRAEGHGGEPGLRLQHDFTRSTATRGMYAVPPAGLPVPGQPLSLTLWIEGDGSGVWPRIQIRSGDGTVSNLDGPHVTWEGWQQVTFPVPTGTAMPIRVDKIRFLEIRPEAQYRGDLTISGLVANVPPPAGPADNPVVHDPVIVTNGTVEDRPQRIAVISDGQFVARNPNSELLANVRRTLREIVAARPDHLVINGDFVDEASPADFALAKRVLDEEVGDAVPWTYVPGNHEVMGGPITNYTSVFGPAHTSTRLGPTQLVTLNTSSLTLHGNDDGIAQLADLEQQLQQAATDPAVTGVLVAMHVPVDDPLADKASQLSDRKEARQLEDRLGRFRTESGKSVAVVNGHVGVFHGSSRRGISTVVNGNSGKTPAGSVADGGFRGWTMLGIDPAKGVVGSAPDSPTARLDWLRAETHPGVDAVELTAPATLAVGSSVSLSPTFRQGDAIVPVAWPVSAQWSGTGVQVDERGAGVVRFDPGTHTLTAVRPGTATLTLVVGGVRSTATVEVPGQRRSGD
ncbi:phosphodiester glycosidase family protein [Knoellia sp. 3-2P3]|uniref:phosphodiester glycosidase family protein n=1 Tax=unclassified Knoellia TaxID=2618719 RepID=UPI0023D9882E|nr:phosphodiester glycosidase family protein [Knoellia sp. 3-2P3]MDF2094283.1 phosphodiester glycosidase family protein [Knoellia sp. 3-2P3]